MADKKPNCLIFSVSTKYCFIKMIISQQTTFNNYFEQIQQQYWEMLGNDYVGTIRRLGLTTFRVAMIEHTNCPSFFL